MAEFLLRSYGYGPAVSSGLTIQSLPEPVAEVVSVPVDDETEDLVHASISNGNEEAPTIKCFKKCSLVCFIACCYSMSKCRNEPIALDLDKMINGV